MALLCSANPIRASLINGNFETGDLTGWQTIGQVTVETANSFGVVPASGQFQALLENHFPGNLGTPVDQLGMFLGLAAGTLDSLGKGAVIQGSALQQTFTANEGDRLSFAWIFLTNSDLPDPDFNDFAFVSVAPALPAQTLSDTFGPLVASDSLFYPSETGYQVFSYQIASAG